MRVKALVLFVVTLAFAASAWAAGTETIIYNFNSYTGDGYYLYDRNYPGVGIAVTVSF